MSATLEDYRVELDDYCGPLDLLLFLVKKNEIDLHDIPMAKLTEQYLQYIEGLERFDINVASEFLVMAATLLEIKSQMLAPKGEASSEEGAEGEAASGGDALSELDPRYELVKQLLAYKRFKDAANSLGARQEEWEARFPYRPAKLPKPAIQLRSDGDYVDGEMPEEAEDAAPVEIDLEDISVTDLCEAFARILESIGAPKAMHAVKYDDTPISLHAADIYDRLKREGPLTLQSIFVGRRTRAEMIGLFLATLELVREKKVKVRQDRIAGEIAIEVRPPEEQLQSSDDKPTDWTDPKTGQMQYEWPSEGARLRAEKRAARRLTRAMGKHDEEDDDEGGFIEIKRENLEDMLKAQTPVQEATAAEQPAAIESAPAHADAPASIPQNVAASHGAPAESSASHAVEVEEPQADLDRRVDAQRAATPAIDISPLTDAADSRLYEAPLATPSDSSAQAAPAPDEPAPP